RGCRRPLRHRRRPAGRRSPPEGWLANPPSPHVRDPKVTELTVSPIASTWIEGARRNRLDREHSRAVERFSARCRIDSFGKGSSLSGRPCGDGRNATEGKGGWGDVSAFSRPIRSRLDSRCSRRTWCGGHSQRQVRRSKRSNQRRVTSG